ncbi:MAG: hypothetical protein KY467_03190 [Gemmatimonadetes bacterium]|nr:hypothetical protein [Gemmatimonadota bacterium]
MRMNMLRMIAVMAFALAACGPAGTSAPGRGNSRLITEQEIQESPTTNLLETVQRLRPGWLTPRYHGGSRGYPAVFVGSQRYGEIDYLRNVETANVREVHFFDPVAASARFGRNVPFGVIQVIVDIGG